MLLAVGKTHTFRLRNRLIVIIHKTLKTNLLASHSGADVEKTWKAH